MRRTGILDQMASEVLTQGTKKVENLQTEGAPWDFKEFPGSF